MRRFSGLLAMAVVLSLGASAQAQVTFFNFTSNNNTGLYSQTYTISGQSLTATAIQGISIKQSDYSLTNAGSASTSGSNTLYEKAPVSNETGLGLKSDPTGNNEIVYGYGIKLDFSAVQQSQPYYITFGSVQNSSHDVAAVYDLANNSLMGTYGQGSSLSLQIGPGATDFQYLITEVHKSYTTGPWWNPTTVYPNILLGAVTVTPAAVPEPSTFAIAGLALWASVPTSGGAVGAPQRARPEWTA